MELDDINLLAQCAHRSTARCGQTTPTMTSPTWSKERETMVQKQVEGQEQAEVWQEEALPASW